MSVRSHGTPPRAAPPHFPGRAPIDAYGNGGFRFGGMSHRGSILCLPSGIHGWSATVPTDLTPAALAAVLDEKDGLALLLLGTGAMQVFPSRDLKQAFATAGIGLEAMATGSAARTYNVLLAEGRQVGAALLAVD